MMAHMGLHDNIKTGIWTKFTSTDNKLENIMVNLRKETWAYEKLNTKISDYDKYLRLLDKWELWVVPSE